MKNFLQKSCLTAIVLCFSVVGFAHDFEVDGIYYNINDDGASVYVTYKGEYYGHYEEYSGDVIIPSDVTHNGTTYRVTFIGSWAFRDCSGLTTVTIPNSVTSIGYDAFSNCSGLASVTIPNSVTSIDSWAFSDCSGLISVTIPNSVTHIWSYTFSGCSGLTSVTIPNSVTSIDISAFSGCSGLTTVTIPNSVTSIGYDAFSDCSGLTSIVVAKENTFYDSRDNCNAIIETKSNTLIAGCENTIIPESVTSIGNSAFRGCIGLTTVTIPNSVTSIGKYAFYNCRGLTSIQCDALTPPSLGSYVFYNVDKMACTLIVPEESLEAYQVADQWKDFLNVSGLKEIAIEGSNISVENGMIINRNNVIIEVYNLSGAKVYTGSDAEVSLNGGLYIVKVGDKVVKIAI